MSDPRVTDRDVYSRLRTLIEAYDRHYSVNAFHCTGVYDPAEYGRWVAEAERLEGIL